MINTVSDGYNTATLTEYETLQTHSVETESPIIHCMLAGGFGGAVGDSLMHSLDTVKTRQQGSPTTLKYRNTFGAYRAIFLEEGLRRGLYGGYGAAMLGSFPSTAVFFGTYEFTKRTMIKEYGINETLTHLTAGFLGDLASSIIFVPSEVLKTRLQLQGRYNNPHFHSGYNYKGLFDAIKTLVMKEGSETLFFGYKATLFRDLPFSALQFAFYEKFRGYAFALSGFDKNDKNHDLSVGFELLTGAAAGGLAGTLTTPLDVIKTRIQTQNPNTDKHHTTPLSPLSTQHSSHPSKPKAASSQAKNYTIPSTAKPAILNTSSIFKGLAIVYKTEGVVGLFSGVGPRFMWTSVQSSVMLLLYQVALRTLDNTLGSEVEFDG